MRTMMRGNINGTPILRLREKEINEEKREGRLCISCINGASKQVCFHEPCRHTRSGTPQTKAQQLHCRLKKGPSATEQQIQLNVSHQNDPNLVSL